MPPPRNTTTRDRHRAIIRKGEPPCALCGEPIDYKAKCPEPLSYVVDHVIPWDVSHDDSLSNKQPAHWRCNRLKSDRLDGGPIIRRSGALKRT